ncbi:hypothetical protein LXA43DRAFT_9086 [Ganoderma leucocontextum]|nr:hypothetical protein LXA43DRAFT_9086 [Ganoderma leucocontextum]
MKLPPPPPRPLLDPYPLDRNLGPQNGSRDTHITENGCHSGWHAFSCTRAPGMPHRLPASVDSVRPCRPVSHPPPPTPSAFPSRRCDHRRRPRVPSPRDRAACARFRLAKKRPSAAPFPSATPAITPSFRPLLRTLCIVVQTPRLATVCMRRLSFGIGGSIRRTCSTLEHMCRSALVVPSDVRQALLTLRVPRALSVILAPFLAKRTVHRPHGRRKSEPSRPRYLLWALGGYVIFALCCLLIWGGKHHSPPPSSEGFWQGAPVWVVDPDVVDIDALRNANPDYGFFDLPI